MNILHYALSLVVPQVPKNGFAPKDCSEAVKLCGCYPSVPQRNTIFK